MQRRKALVFSIAVIGVGVGWSWFASNDHVGSGGRVTALAVLEQVDANRSMEPLDHPRCEVEARFIRHDLDHVTRSSDAPARLFDSNGSGVAADDLDGNGLADIVLGNLEGPNTILWNEGDWRFTTERMQDRSVRSVQLVDVDADGLLDIVTTHRGSGVAVFRNQGARQFERMPLRGVTHPAYSMAWGDIDLDGDLDLVTGSYDAELDQQLRSTFLFSDGAGVYVYRNDGTEFVGERLADRSQALVSALLDLDHDGALDLVVGNDFALPDMSWRNTDGTFAAFEPFQLTSAHTMSIDAGDIDADGIEEVFATDMRPASTDTAVIADWLPLMATMNALDNPSGSQRVRNVLQVDRGHGRYTDQGSRAGVDAAGWAWSARFGDLENDGDLDLYVVNGMIAAETFSFLNDAELIEPNITFVNRGQGIFDRASWGLDALESGRGSVLVDVNDDGALDVVVNNLDSPATAFENRTCGGDAIEVTLSQPHTANTHALGATVVVVTGDHRQVRTVRSGSGYLSGSPTTLHIGLGDETPERIEVRWPDGTATTIEQPQSNSHYEVVKQVVKQ